MVVVGFVEAEVVVVEFAVVAFSVVAAVAVEVVAQAVLYFVVVAELSADNLMAAVDSITIVGGEDGPMSTEDTYSNLAKVVVVWEEAFAAGTFHNVNMVDDVHDTRSCSSYCCKHRSDGCMWGVGEDTFDYGN